MCYTKARQKARQSSHGKDNWLSWSHTETEHTCNLRVKGRQTGDWRGGRAGTHTRKILRTPVTEDMMYKVKILNKSRT